MTAMAEEPGIGPVEVAVMVFTDHRLNGGVATALASLQRSGTVRIIDLALVSKDAGGGAGIVELEDTDLSADFAAVNEDPLDLLSDEDLTGIAEDLEPGATALVVVWEDVWAAELARAVRACEGEVVALERVPRETVLTALADLDQPSDP